MNDPLWLTLHIFLSINFYFCYIQQYRVTSIYKHNTHLRQYDNSKQITLSKSDFILSYLQYLLVNLNLSFSFLLKTFHHFVWNIISDVFLNIRLLNQFFR